MLVIDRNALGVLGGAPAFSEAATTTGSVSLAPSEDIADGSVQALIIGCAAHLKLHY